MRKKHTGGNQAEAHYFYEQNRIHEEEKKRTQENKDRELREKFQSFNKKDLFEYFQNREYDKYMKNKSILDKINEILNLNNTQIDEIRDSDNYIFKFLDEFIKSYLTVDDTKDFIKNDINKLKPILINILSIHNKLVEFKNINENIINNLLINLFINYILNILILKVI